MPTRSVCQLEFRCPMSLPRALKESSGCISMTTTFAPSSAARRAVAVPAWPAPRTTMSGLDGSRYVAFGDVQAWPSLAGAQHLAHGLAGVAGGRGAPRSPQTRRRPAVPPSGPKWRADASLFGLHPASMPAPAAPGRQRARALQESCGGCARCGPRFLAKAARWASVQRGSFLSTFSPFLSCLGMPRSRPAPWRADRQRLLGCRGRRLRAVAWGRGYVERPDYGPA